MHALLVIIIYIYILFVVVLSIIRLTYFVIIIHHHIIILNAQSVNKELDTLFSVLLGSLGFMLDLGPGFVYGGTLYLEMRYRSWVDT